MTILANTAGIDRIAPRLAPALSLNLGPPDAPVAVANLTGGFNPDPNQVEIAFRLLGHVKVTGSAAGIRFGFIQFVRHSFMGVFYAGRRRSEGSVGVLIDPLITHAFMVDPLSPSTLPFQRPSSTGLTNGEGIGDTGDHPLFAIAQEQHNFTTGAKNFLFHIVDTRDAYCIFSAQDASGSLTHLANIRWELRYDFKVSWAGGTPRVAASGSTFSFGPVMLGAPSDPALPLGSLGPTMSPIASVQARNALRSAMVHPNPNRSDNAGWFHNVPSSFYA